MASVKTPGVFTHAELLELINRPQIYIEADLAKYRQELIAQRSEVCYFGEKFLDEVEGFYKEGKFQQALGLLAKCDSSSYCDGEALYSRHLLLVTNISNALVKMNCAFAIHRFFRSRIATWQKRFLKNLDGSPLDKISAEESTYPYLLDWCGRYIKFCEQVGDVEKLKQAKDELERVVTKNFPVPKRYPKDSRPMNEETFWSLIEAARNEASKGEVDFVEDLSARLEKRKQSDLVAFDVLVYAKAQSLLTSQVWGVGYVVAEGMSDDSFIYFAAWIVSQGRSFYEACLKDIESAFLSRKPSESYDEEGLLYMVEELFDLKDWNSEKLVKKRPALEPPEIDWKESEIEGRHPKIVAWRNIS